VFNINVQLLVSGGYRDRGAALDESRLFGASSGDAAPHPGRSYVGWVERSDTHRASVQGLMGFATLYPSYELHGFLMTLGAKIIRAPREDQWAPGYYSILFEDPDGIRLELNHVRGKGLLA
jgi:hypothetical protein